MNISSLIDLCNHMQWADATVWDSVLSSDTGRADSNLRDCLYHLHMVQRAFLRVWRGEPRHAPYPTFDDTHSLMEWARGYYDEASSFISALVDDKLSEPMPVPWSDMVERRLGRAPEVTTIGETVLQVALHSQYHRGQINRRLRELGVEPPLVDYIAWVWMGRPEAKWP